MNQRAVKQINRYLPVILFLLFLAFLYISGIHRYLNFHLIQEEHVKLQHFVDLHPLLSSLLYLAIYMVSVYLVIPDSILLSLLAGFLFPLPLALLYICLSETVGATLFFLTIRGFFKETMSKLHKPLLLKVQKEFQDNAVSYILFLRFSHMFPFWLINILTACFQVPLWRFIWTAFVGIAPLAYILAAGGQGLSKFLKTGQEHPLHAFFNTEVDIALIGMGLLALLPVALKKWKNRKKS